MPVVKFTRNLQRFFPDLHSVEVDGRTVFEVIQALDSRFPGLAGYVLDDHNALRQHVNVFIGEDLIADRRHLSDPVSDTDQVYILQALSGGWASP